MFSLKNLIKQSCFAFGFILTLGMCLLSFAQTGATSSRIVGTIADQQGALIGGATLTATNLSTNTAREAISAENGEYTLTQLTPGIYRLRVDVEGFKSYAARVELGLGVDMKIDIQLVIAAADTDVVEVRGSSIINEGQTASSTSQETARIKDLPINRRNFLDFSLTSPRVTASRAPAQGITSDSGLSFNGQPARNNNVTIDGLDNNESTVGAVRTTFSQDAVQEFQVNSDSYSAEFGRASGGVVNIITRGGTNEFHGSTFFLNRNDKISARDVFSSFKPPFSQYQFGATLSGPLKKDKAYFFSSFERLSISQNQFVTISDLAIASINSQGGNLRNGPNPFGIATTSALVRGDFKVSENNTFYARYNYGGSYDGNFEPFGGLTAATAQSVLRVDDHSGAFNNTYINAGLNLVNETRFLFNNRTASSRGVIAGPQTAIFAPEGGIIYGPSTSSQPLALAQRNINFVNQTSLVRGNHQMKFGFDYLRNSTPGDRTFILPFNNGFSVFNPIDFAAQAGLPGLPFFSGLENFDPSLRSPAQLAFLQFLSGVLPSMFPGFPSGLPLTDLPLPTAFIQGFGDGQISFKSNAFSAFFQDDIKVKPNLLVKLGVRYDIQRSFNVPDNNGNVSPRFAFSYNPKFLPKLHVHGAYGLFFARQLFAFGAGVDKLEQGLQRIYVVPFPFAILPNARPGRNYADFSTFPSDLPFIPQLSATFEYNKKLRNTYAQQVNFGLDYYLDNNTLVSANYNYARGLKLFQERNVNPTINPDPNIPGSGRPDPNRGDVIQYASDGDSYYHSLTLRAERRFSQRVNFLAFYTLAKAIDNFFDVRVDLTSGPVNPLRIRDEKGLSNQDVRHRFVLSGVWDLDYTKNKFLTGFKLSTILTLNSGVPFNLLAGVDLNNSGDTPPSDRPLIGGVSIGRNLGVQPGFASMDLRLTRKVAFEKFAFEGFVEAFNIFNRTNINRVANVFLPDANGNFSLPTERGANGRFEAPKDRYIGAFSPRQFQLGFRFTF